MRTGGMRTDRKGEFDVGVDRLSGDGDERQTGEGDRGSFNALINAPASFLPGLGLDGASHANKNAAFAGLSESG